MSTATLPSPQATALRELVAAAVLAPSPDNNQPWKFAMEGNRLLVYLDPQRALPSDVNSMFDLIGLGAAVENACIAARQSGHEPRVDCHVAPDASSAAGHRRPVATITLTPGGDPDPLYAHLRTRCTCRKPYSKRPIPEASLAAMSRAAEAFPEVQLNWITDRRRIRAMARLIAASDRIRFEYEPFHNELFRQLRFSAEEAERTRDGLDLRTLELPPGAGFLLRQLRPWNRMEWVHRLGVGRLLTVPSALSVRRSGALGVVSVSKPATEYSLGGGRAFQRLWLAAQGEGLALQPLGSLAIFFAHVEQLRGRRLSPRHAALVRKLIGRFHELAPAVAGRTHVILFRLGHARPPRHRSLRRAVADVLDQQTHSK